MSTGNRQWPTPCLAPGSRLRILAILLVCALIEGTCCLVFFRTEGRGVGWVTPPGDESAGPTLAANETGAFSARRLDGGAGYRPAFRVSWTNLRIEDGRLGILSTPLHKTVIVDALAVQSHRYSHTQKPQKDGAVLTETISDLAWQLREGRRGMKVRSPLLDARRATHVIVRGLDYSVFRDDQQELAIQCRYAAAAVGASQIELRGGVTIQADGGTLMANFIRWDVERSQIDVPGTYVLTRNGVPVRGRGIRCDLHWRPSAAREVNGEKGAAQWAEAVSF
jgi:hypothetical protein